MMTEQKQVIPEGYKKTDIGIIPIDWKATALGEIADVRMCKRILAWQTQKSGAIPFFKIGTFGAQPDTYIPLPLYEEFKAKYSYPNEGDILISAAGTLGKSVIYDGKPAYFQDSNIVWLEVDKKELLNEYLFHYYKVIKWASSEGSTIARLYNGIIRSSVIALPSTKEQTAIANALSDVDALISELEKLIAKKQAIKTATMQQLLTGKTRLPEFALREDGTPKGYKQSELGEIPEDWEVVELGNVLNLPATYGVVTAGKFQTSGVRMVRGGDIKNGTISSDMPFISKTKNEEYSRTILQANDVVIALVGYPGESAKIPDWLVGSNISRAVGLLRLKRLISSDFLVHYLNSEAGRKNFLTPSAGSAQIVVNLVDLNKLNIPAPSEEEQTFVALILSEMDKEIQVLELRLNKTRQIKQGMMQELLTGKTRLVKPEVTV